MPFISSYLVAQNKEVLSDSGLARVFPFCYGRNSLLLSKLFLVRLAFSYNTMYDAPTVRISWILEYLLIHLHIVLNQARRLRTLEQTHSYGVGVELKSH